MQTASVNRQSSSKINLVTAFIPISFRHIRHLLMAIGFACIPAARGEPGTGTPDNAAGEQLTERQREIIKMRQEELTKAEANIELTKAKIAALKEKIESQKGGIGALTAEIEGKERAILAGMGGQAADSAGVASKAGAKMDLPARFIADLTPRIVIIEGDKGSGTGFLCRSGDNVWVYTAAHVLSGNHTITVRDNTGRIYREFEFLECAEGVDLVRLKPKDGGLDGLDLVSPDEAPKVGEIIVAIGNSLGAGSLSGEPGHIMSVQDDMWEVDAEIIPGNSGGPVISFETGKVVGIVTHLTIGRGRDQNAPPWIGEKTEVKRFAARLDKRWEWRRMPVSRFVKEWEHIEEMDRESSIAWASVYLMHTGPEARAASEGRTGQAVHTDPDQVKLAESILARDRTHIQVQRVDDWLKRYRAAGTVRHNELIEAGNKIIQRNLDEIRLKDNAPKAADFSWFHRQSYEAEIAWRKKLTD
jgi:S1-C subfamily serine protease